MAIIPFKIGGGGGASSEDVTATKAQVLSGYTAVTHDSNDEVVGGTMPNRTDSGNATLTPSSTSKSYASGYYANAHGAQISPQSKSVTPSVSAQTVSPDTGRVLSSVSVGAIPNQKSDSGNVTLTPLSQSKSYAAGYYSNAHGAQISSQEKTATSNGSVTPDNGRVLSKVTVAIPTYTW